MAFQEPFRRKKLRAEPSQAKVSDTSLFAPFRSLGHVTNAVPLSVYAQYVKGKKTPHVTIISCLGRSWAQWNLADMKLLFVGEFSHDLSESLVGQRFNRKLISQVNLLRISSLRCYARTMSSTQRPGQPCIAMFEDESPTSSKQMGS